MKLFEWIDSKKNDLEFNELYYLAKAAFGFIIALDQELNNLHLTSLETYFNLRKQGVPLSKIVKYKAFYNDIFFTNEHTLDPRPETEYLIDKVSFKPRTILELGVGTGCLILSLIKKFPKSKGLAIDIFSEALKVAKFNAELLNLTSKIQFLKNNWANGLTGYYDLIVANPPYVNKDAELDDSIKFDPAIALFGDLNTYIDLIHSLIDIRFNELLIEIPKYLINSFENFLKDQSMFSYSFEQIYNTDIFVAIIYQK